MHDIIGAIEARAWYPAAGLGAMLLLRLARQVAPAAWARVPRRWQWLPVVVMAALAALADAYAGGATVEVAVAMVAYAALSAMTAIGAHHTARRVGGEP
jgi:hypothetical protein